MQRTRVHHLRRLHTGQSRRGIRSYLRTVAGTARSNRNGLLTLTLRTTHTHTSLNRVSFTIRGMYNHRGTIVHSVSNMCSDRFRSSSMVGRMHRVTSGFRRLRNHHPHVVVTGVNRSNRSHNTGIVTASFTSVNFSISVKPLFRAPRRATRSTISGSIRVIKFDSLTTKRGALLPRLMRRLGGQNHKSVLITVNNMVPTRSCRFLHRRNTITVFNPNAILPMTTGGLLRALADRIRSRSRS